MRDIQSNPITFCRSVEKHSTKMFIMRIETLRSAVVNNSNFHSENQTFFSLRNLKLKDIIRLAIVSWYIPEEVGTILRLDLEAKIKNLAKEDRTIVELLLQSKGQMLKFLLETQLWHSRDFFGNILSTKIKLDNFFKPSPPRRKVRRPQRKRGYDDHGSKVPDSKWTPKYDWSLTELQMKIETDRKIHQDTVAFLQGFLF